MTQENNQEIKTEATENPDAPNSNNQNSEENTTKEQNVPLNTFLEEKKKLKELKQRLVEYEAKDKKIAEAKLIEEKNFQELILNKEKDLLEANTLLENERKSNKLEKIKNRFSNELTKLNVIDADDALRLVKYDDLLESESFDEEIKDRAANLVTNKAYLFNASKTTRSSTENGQPSGINQTKPGVLGKVDPIIAGLVGKLNK